MSRANPATTTSVAVAAGTWKLATGRAMSLRPRQAFVLSIAQGRVWATVDTPHRGAPCAGSDHVLVPGDRLTVAAGRRLVVETWGAPARFGWDPAPAPAPLPLPQRPPIAQPLRDLRQALRLAFGAAARLVRALAGRRPAVASDNCNHGASQILPA